MLPESLVDTQWVDPQHLTYADLESIFVEEPAPYEKEDFRSA